MAPVDRESINSHHAAWFARRQDGVGLSLLLPGPFISCLPGGWKRGPGSILVRWHLTPTLGTPGGLLVAMGDDSCQSHH